MTIVLSELLAKVVTVKRAQELNADGYAVTISNGKVLIEKEKATSIPLGDKTNISRTV